MINESVDDGTFQLGRSDGIKATHHIDDDPWEYGFCGADGEEAGYMYEDVLDRDGAFTFNEDGTIARRRRKVPLSNS